MFHALALAMLVFAVPGIGAVQALSVLHIKVVLVDAERKAAPVPRHALLVSDNPASAPPRRIVTRLDGTADVTLRPGSYTIESDRPIVFQGKAYQWTQTVDVVAGRDAVLELTAQNADVETGPSTAVSSGGADPSSLLIQWQDSIVALWTPTTRASGFLFDARGLIATSQRIVGTASSVEVQLTPAVKVAANVLAADPVRDVAILWIDPQVIEAVRPLPLPCAQPAKAVAEGDELLALGVPLHGQKRVESGTVGRIEAQAILSDLILATGSEGGPVFNAGGEVIGMTTVAGSEDDANRVSSRVVSLTEACALTASADKIMKDAKPPAAARLPVEPAKPFPLDALKEIVPRRAGSLLPYQMSSSDFDIAFITPVHTYGAQYQTEQASDRERRSGSRDATPPLARPLTDFSNWSEYVADFPPVLLVRVTPKLVERFWTTVARGAARTQGLSIPPIKHFKSGFSSLRAFCGDAEVTPIHPFKLEQRVSESEAIYEGLYVFDPGALGPQCATVKFMLFSDKTPAKGDTRVVDPQIVQHIWQDFLPWRER
jgi:S1-C subfamily serine protease